MGLDIELFVDGKSISTSLICGICLGVVEEPVLTPTDSLYCEACLLEWLTKSSLDPLTNVVIVPEHIKKPSRLVLNILADLIRKCPNEGCPWQGSCDLFKAHTKSCRMLTRAILLDQILSLETVNEALQKKYDESRAVSRELLQRVNELVTDNKDLAHELALANSKLRVYDSFFASVRTDTSAGGSFSSSAAVPHDGDDSLVTALGRRGQGQGRRGRGSGRTAFDDINDYYGGVDFGGGANGGGDDDVDDDDDNEEKAAFRAFRQAIGVTCMGESEGKAYMGRGGGGGDDEARVGEGANSSSGSGDVTEIQRLRRLATFGEKHQRK